MTTKINFGLLIRQLLKKQKITIQAAAEMIGYTRQGLSDILEKEDVNTLLLKKICDALGVEMNYFLNTGSYTAQSGKHNVIADGGSTVYGNSNTVANKHDNAENLLLLNENNSLKREIELLREMVDLLKGAKNIQPRKDSKDDDDVQKYILSQSQEQQGFHLNNVGKMDRIGGIL